MHVKTYGRSTKIPKEFASEKIKPICGYKVLKSCAMACGAKYRNAISATRLRKHLTTLTQLIGMSKNNLAIYHMSTQIQLSFTRLQLKIQSFLF